MGRSNKERKLIEAAIAKYEFEVKLRKAGIDSIPGWLRERDRLSDRLLYATKRVIEERTNGLQKS
jgi:hypothetical protein